LAAVDHVVIALFHGARAYALEVGAGARLGHANRAHQLAAREPGQPALLLRLGAVVQHVVRAHAVHALPEGADAAARELGVHDGLVAKVAPAATVFGRYVQQQQAGLARPAPGFAVDVVLLAPFRIARNHFSLDETHDGVAKHLEVIVHPG